MKFEYYSGHVKDANLTILDVVERSYPCRNTIYEVRLDCCGSKTLMEHKRITERVSKKTSKCRSCYYSDKGHVPGKGDSTPYIWPQPDWPVPPSTVSAGHWIWEDSHG